MVHIYGGWRCCKLEGGNKATIYIVGDWVESSFKWRPRHSLGIFCFFRICVSSFYDKHFSYQLFSSTSQDHLQRNHHHHHRTLGAGSLARSYLKVVGIKA